MFSVNGVLYFKRKIIIGVFFIRFYLECDLDLFYSIEVEKEIIMYILVLSM